MSPRKKNEGLYVDKKATYFLKWMRARSLILASKVFIPNSVELVHIDWLSNHKLRLFIRIFPLWVANNAVLKFFGLFGINFDELLLILNGLGLKNIIEHLCDGFKSGIVFDPEAIENGVKISIRLEDVIIHAADAVHGLLELGVLALFEEFEGVLFFRGRGRGFLHLLPNNLMIIDSQSRIK
jgi:hypothetical protein